MNRPMLLGALGIGAWLARAALRRSRRYDLGGKVVLITGGGRGLGLQVAREAAKRGAKLALFSRSHVELEAARSELEPVAPAVSVAVCDVRSGAQVRATVDRFVRELGPIDVVFNVAGVIEVGPVDALTMSDYEDAIQTNYLGAVRTVEAVRASMCERRTGRIVNITSLGGKVPVPHLLPYSASKFALVGYSEGLRAELARYGVVVTTIVPGLMRTGSPPQATFAGQPEKEYAMFAPSDALPFTSVSVQEAARAVIDACEHGDIERIISPQAKLAVYAYAVLPRFITAAMGGVTRVLPDAGGSTEHRYGHESESEITRSPLGALGRRATQTQNEALDQRSS